MNKYTINDFERQLDAIPAVIDEIRLQRCFVTAAFGHIEDRKYKWNALGKCFTMQGVHCPHYDLKLDEPCLK